MKEKLVELARTCFRALPISPLWKKRVQFFCFSKLPFLFQHLPGYQIWSLQNPLQNEKEIAKLDLPAIRAEALKLPNFQSKGEPTIVMVSHDLGGGTEHHVKQLSEKLQAEGINSWIIRSLGKHHIRLLPFGNKSTETLIYSLETEVELLLKQLESLNIRLIHVHHLVDFGPDFADKIRSFAERLEMPYDFTAHDYLSICPRYTLYDDAVRGYCGEPDVKRCQGCVKTFGSAAGKDVNVRKWRDDYAEFLKGARHIYTPDLDVKNRLERYLPDSKILNRPHWDEREITPLKRQKKENRPLRILTLGAIAPHKGSMILKECAEDAKKRGLSIEFTLIGFSDIDYQLKKFMKVTGPYKPEELPDMLREGQFDAVFLPAVWPETFNYTLSEILHFGLYPISFDIGAIGRRITEIGYGSVLAYDIYRDAEAINNQILGIDIPESVPVEKLKAAQVSYGNLLEDYYNLAINSAN